MRITSPPPDARADLDQLDLSAIPLFTEGDAHLAWRTLRATRPVFWNRVSPGDGFWVVTRYPDVRRVLEDYTAFSSEQGTAVDLRGVPDPAARIMMHATDPPCHQRIREPLGRPLSARALTAREPTIRTLVRAAVNPIHGSDPWDVAEVLTRLPVAAIVHLIGLPATDTDWLLRLAYASVAPADARYRNGSAPQTLQWAHSNLVDYFTRWVRRRRREPGYDLLSHLATMDVAGRPMAQDAVVANCYSLLVGGVVTTAQVVTATLVALAGPHDGAGRWPGQTAVSLLVEEALRWSSPTTHFMRSARHDVEISGVRIRQGDPVTAWIASANRDEGVFPRPFEFVPGRRFNRHLAFGAGPHRCVGRQLARLVLRMLFEEFAVVDRFELLAPPDHLASNLIAGIVGLPIRVRSRTITAATSTAVVSR
jgi:cytochrome P450